MGAKFLAGLTACSLMLMPASAMADVQYLQGKILQTQGHINPACRMVQVKSSSDGSVTWFRIPNTGADNSILAITMTALTTGLQVNISYEPTVTTGCGTEPEIEWIALLSGN